MLACLHTTSGTISVIFSPRCYLPTYPPTCDTGLILTNADDTDHIVAFQDQTRAQESLLLRSDYLKRIHGAFLVPERAYMQSNCRFLEIDAMASLR